MVAFLEKENSLFSENFKNYSTILGSNVGRLLVTAASAGSVVTAALSVALGDFGTGLMSSSLLALFSFYYLFVKSNKKEVKRINKEEYISNRKHDKIMKELVRELKHELRTPVSCIVSAEEILQDTKLDEHQALLLRNMTRSAEYLEKIIGNINTYRKIKGDTIGSSNVCNLRQMMEEIHQTFETKAQKKGLKIHLRMDKSIPENINLYEVHLKRILMNLLSNAVKYTEKGEIYFTAQINQVVSEHGFTNYQLQFTVKDTGKGIPKNLQQKVFEKNIRVDNNDNLGTGLGLTLCRDLVDELDGYINVDSELGSGSTFRCFIPIEEKPLNTKEILSNEERKKEILIVEDNASSQLILKHLLTDHFDKIHTASNEKEALKICKNVNVDLVLMDVNLPNKNGYELSQQINQLCAKNNKNIPNYIGLSGEDIEEQNKVSKEYGFFASLQKPYKKTQLLDLIRKALRNKKKSRKIAA